MIVLTFNRNIASYLKECNFFKVGKHFNFIIVRYLQLIMYQYTYYIKEEPILYQVFNFIITIYTNSFAEPNLGQ